MHSYNLPTDQAIQILTAEEVRFDQPHPQIYVASIPIANASWVNTSEGTVVIDTLLNRRLASRMKQKLIASGGRVKKIIFTHHHSDHVGGASVFLEEQPEIIAHHFLIENLEKYEILKEHRARIASIQFNIPYRPERFINFIRPTRTFYNDLVFSLGGLTFELHHARAETDDAVWIFVPEIKTVFVGDLIIAGFPNIGNPFKPTRFALPWARALEAIRAQRAELLIAHGGRAVYRGKEIEDLLNDTIEAIYTIHDQVVEGINREVPIDELIHHIELPMHLKNSPYLSFVYSRPEFAAYNIYRWYHGYYDHNPAHLLPRPEKEVNEEIIRLIGDERKILERSKSLLEEGKTQLALQVLDVLLKHHPDHVEALTLRVALLKKLCAEDSCLMSRNAWVAAIEQDRKKLQSLSS